MCDCFTQERKGGSVKRAAEHLEFGARFERTALFKVWHEELRSLSDAHLWSDRLIGKQHFWAELRCNVSRGVVWRHVQYFAGDVVFADCGTPLLLEAACCSEDGRYSLLVTQLSGGARVTDTASRWRLPEAEEPMLFPLDRDCVLKHAAMWDFEGDAQLLILER